MEPELEQIFLAPQHWFRIRSMLDRIRILLLKMFRIRILQNKPDIESLHILDAITSVVGPGGGTPRSSLLTCTKIEVPYQTSHSTQFQIEDVSKENPPSEQEGLGT
jgi:hypothetical protein